MTDSYLQAKNGENQRRRRLWQQYAISSGIAALALLIATSIPEGEALIKPGLFFAVRVFSGVGIHFVLIYILAILLNILLYGFIAFSVWRTIVSNIK
jgi:hypothetical protein